MITIPEKEEYMRERRGCVLKAESPFDRDADRTLLGEVLRSISKAFDRSELTGIDLTIAVVLPEQLRGK